MNRRQAPGSTGSIGSSSTKTPSCDKRFSTSSAACSICASPWWRSASRSARNPPRRRRRAGSRAPAPGPASSGRAGRRPASAAARGGSAPGATRRRRRLGRLRARGAGAGSGAGATAAEPDAAQPRASAARPRAAPGRRATRSSCGAEVRPARAEHRRLHRLADRLRRGRPVPVERAAGRGERVDQRRRHLGQRRDDLALALELLGEPGGQPDQQQRQASAIRKNSASSKSVPRPTAVAATPRKPIA